MLIISPKDLYKSSKEIYRRNVYTLGMKTKMAIILIILALLANSYFGVSNTLIVNSRVDTITQMKESASLKDKIRIENDIKEQLSAVANYKDIFVKTKESFHATDEDALRSPLANTLTVAFIPIVLFILGVYFLILKIVIKREGQWEHIVNLLLLCATAFGLFWLMIGVSDILPTFPEGFVWANYGFNVFFSLLLYLLLAFFITSISERLSLEAHSLDANNHGGNEIPDAPALAEGEPNARAEGEAAQ